MNPRTLPAAREATTALDPGRRRAARGSSIRSTLVACTAEGVVTEFAAACCGAGALTAWALYLHAGTWVVGLLGALPFLAQLVQIPFAYVTARVGVKRATVSGIAGSRLLYFALAALPFLPLHNRARVAVLFAVAALAAGLNVLGGNGWSAWMGNLLPPSIRGRYLGRRTSLCTLASAVAALVTGAVLDGGRRAHADGASLAVLAGIVGVTGLVCAALLGRMKLPEVTSAPPSPRLADAVEPLCDPRARSVLAYQTAWGAATGLSCTFYAIFMVEVLHIGFLGVTLHAVTTSVARTLAAPLWGRAMDRVGTRPVLIASAAGIAVVSFAWVFASPAHLWILALDALIAGSLDAGQMLGSMTLPLRVSPRERLPFYLAAFGMASGLVFGLASIAGGAAISALPARVHLAGLTASRYAVIFGVGSILRGIAALTAARIAEPGAGTVRDLIQLVTVPLAQRRVSAATE